MTGFRSILRIVCIGLAAACVGLTAWGMATAARAADFYSGKTVAIDVGFPPGGGYDNYARFLARDWGNFIPGRPTFVVKNLPGAGSLKAANFIYNTAPKDGTEMAAVSQGVIFEPLFRVMGSGNEARFELDQVRLDRRGQQGTGSDGRVAHDAVQVDRRPAQGEGSRHRHDRPDRQLRHLSAPDERDHGHPHEDHLGLQRHLGHHGGAGARRAAGHGGLGLFLAQHRQARLAGEQEGPHPGAVRRAQDTGARRRAARPRQRDHQRRPRRARPRHRGPGHRASLYRAAGPAQGPARCAAGTRSRRC